MKVEILEEWGWQYALYGLSRSYNQPLDKMPRVAQKIAYRNDDSHWKFLRHVKVSMIIIAPRYWWQQFDTYRHGIEKQSGSTMHTILKRKLTQNDFQNPICSDTLERLNFLIETSTFDTLKNELPEGFLQERQIITNYQTLYRIWSQRCDHKLGEWKYFCDELECQLKFFSYCNCQVDNTSYKGFQDMEYFKNYIKSLPNYDVLLDMSKNRK